MDLKSSLVQKLRKLNALIAGLPNGRETPEYSQLIIEKSKLEQIHLAAQSSNINATQELEMKLEACDIISKSQDLVIQAERNARIQAELHYTALMSEEKGKKNNN